MELGNIYPRPPAIRIFDAGVGDGTVLTCVMRAMHQRFPILPSYIVGKEISLQGVRLVLDKMPDRLCEHPATVLVMTNMYYSEAPWLVPNSMAAATGLMWHEVALTGTTAHEFEQQITDLQPFLSEHWRARISPRSGNPIYDRPVVLVVERGGHEFLLGQRRPRRGAPIADYDLVIASQPYRARAPVEFKAKRILAPLTRALAPGGRLIVIHSHGDDPGLEIIRKIWPGENPFRTDRHQLLRATKIELGSVSRDYNLAAYPDARSLFRYEMHTLPSEISDAIGTSTLWAAWNAAVYVARSTMGACLRRLPIAPISTPHKRYCESMAACGSGTKLLSSRASGGLGERRVWIQTPRWRLCNHRRELPTVVERSRGSVGKGHAAWRTGQCGQHHGWGERARPYERTGGRCHSCSRRHRAGLPADLPRSQPHCFAE